MHMLQINMGNKLIKKNPCYYYFFNVIYGDNHNGNNLDIGIKALNKQILVFIITYFLNIIYGDHNNGNDKY